MKKIIGILLAMCLLFALAVPAFAAGDKTLKIWVPDATKSFTEEQVAKFMEANPEYADYAVTVEAVGEGDAASNVLTDLEAGADIFNFAQDQLARLVAAGALIELSDENAAIVAEENAAGSVAAATMGDLVYAYPLTSDNGYFLYYDKSVISDPSTLEGVVAACEAAGKGFYMEINSGWYQPAFFFGAGCTLTYDTDDTGAFKACNIDYASDAGVAALKAMIYLVDPEKIVLYGTAFEDSYYLSRLLAEMQEGVDGGHAVSVEKSRFNQQLETKAAGLVAVDAFFRSGGIPAA